MKTKLFSAVAGVALLALAGAANAGEPVRLSDAQMDGVTAGTTAVSVGIGIAVGDLAAASVVTADTVVIGLNATATGSTTSVAASLAGPAVAVAVTQVAATSP